MTLYYQTQHECPNCDASIRFEYDDPECLLFLDSHSKQEIKAPVYKLGCLWCGLIWHECVVPESYIPLESLP
jgi:hypothetical protein